MEPIMILFQHNRNGENLVTSAVAKMRTLNLEAMRTTVFGHVYIKQ